VRDGTGTTRAMINLFFRRKPTKEQQAAIQRAEVEGRKAWMLLVVNQTRARQYLRRKQYRLSAEEVSHVVGCEIEDLELLTK
jgi:hypothetical protein